MADKPQSRVKKLDATAAFAIMRKDDNTKIAQIRIPTTLSVAAGTLTATHSALGTIVSADGYILLAADCALATKPAETVVVNGREQPNGFRDENGVIYYRYQCGGFTLLGQPYVTEATVSFDLKAYNMQDLLAKMDKHPDAFMLLSKDDPRPASTATESWAAYPLDDSVVLYLNTKYKDASKWMKDIQQQKKFGDRKAQQMAKRNAIKGHPNIVRLGVNTDVGQGEVVVMSSSFYDPKGGPMMMDGTHLAVDLDKLLSDPAAVVDDGGGEIIDVASHEETLAAARADQDVADTIDSRGEDLPFLDEEEQTAADNAKRATLLEIVIAKSKTKKEKENLEKAREMLEVSEDCEIGEVELDKLEEIVRLISMT